MIIKDINNRGLKEILCVIQGEVEDYSAEKIVIPDGVDSIGHDAFCNFRNLKEVVMPDSVKAISSGAFEKCVNLEKVTLSKRLSTIAPSAFSHCHSLEDINFKDIKVPRLTIGVSAFSHCKNLAEVIFPDDVDIELLNDVFLDCEVLKNVVIPRAKYIGEHVFTYDYNLKHIVLGKKQKDDNTKPDILHIKKDAFSISGIEELDLTDLVYPLTPADNIPERLCYACDDLKTVKLPDVITEIGEEAFSECGSLMDINIPKATTHIRRRCFYKCSALKTVIIPDDVEYIADEAFAHSGLSLVIINSDVITFGKGVFEQPYIKHLKNVTIPSNVRFDSWVFGKSTAVTINRVCDQ